MKIQLSSKKNNKKLAILFKIKRDVLNQSLLVAGLDHDSKWLSESIPTSKNTTEYCLKHYPFAVA